MTLQIITTTDGSHSLLSTELDETYHSVHGAVQESEHVFIRNGLDYYVQKNPSDKLRIFEVGFGTGLNVLLSVNYVRHASFVLDYHSIEAWPITAETARDLNYPKILNTEEGEQIFHNLHDTPWNQSVAILPNFFLEKRQERLETATLNEGQFDIIYFDAFAPNKQPELWELPILQKVESSMKPGGIFVTYCAKGQLKRDLKSLGLAVETLQGPPGKKEMVRATKPS